MEQFTVRKGIDVFDRNKINVGDIIMVTWTYRNTFGKLISHIYTGIVNEFLNLDTELVYYGYDHDMFLNHLLYASDIGDRAKVEIIHKYHFN